MAGESLWRKEGRSRKQLRIAYFTAGTLGAGHLVRGLAIRRALERRNCSVTYRVFAPRSVLADMIIGSYVPVEISTRELRQPASAAASQLAASFDEFEPDLLLVDLFWAPLVHIPLSCAQAWLLVRSCPVKWLGTLAGFTFDPSRYKRVIAIEPTAVPSITDRVPPIVMANPTECEAPGALRERFGVRADDVLDVTVGGHDEASTKVVRRRTTVTLRLGLGERSADLFPVCRWLGDANTIRMSAGYNSYWESVWLGYRSRTTFTPLRRPIDDQDQRLAYGADVPMAANGADVLAADISDHLQEVMQ